MPSDAIKFIKPSAGVHSGRLTARILSWRGLHSRRRRFLCARICWLNATTRLPVRPAGDVAVRDRASKLGLEFDLSGSE